MLRQSGGRESINGTLSDCPGLVFANRRGGRAHPRGSSKKENFGGQTANPLHKKAGLPNGDVRDKNDHFTDESEVGGIT